MKYIRSICALLIFISILACKDTSGEPEKKEQKETTALPVPSIAEVEAVVKSFNEALVNPTAEKLNNLCADNLSYGHSSGLVQNKEVFVNDVVNGSFDFVTVEGPEQTIFLSGETAVVRNLFVSKATNKGEPLDIKLGNVQIYQRQEDGSWKLLMRQAFKL